MSVARSIARASRSNFTAAFYLLPAAKREALFTVYAFSRLVDDAVDEAADSATAARELSDWRGRLEGCYGKANGPPHPLMAELRETIERFEIPKAYFLDLLRGVEMDLGNNRYETFEDLSRYCYHVAGTIGLLCNQIFGRRDDAGRRYAVALGTAFQLTNILRDVGSDARRGRVYLPREDLRRFQCGEEELLQGRRPGRFDELMSFEAERAGRFFEEAERLLSARERRKLVAAEAMAAVYRRLLKKLVREQFPVFEGKMRLSRIEKVWLLTRAAVSSVL